MPSCGLWGKRWSRPLKSGTPFLHNSGFCVSVVNAMLKTTYRQYQQCTKMQTMLKNNLISLLDTVFPAANRLFTSPARANGSEKRVHFVVAFPHRECVWGLSERAFTAKHQKWCKKHGYNFSQGGLLYGPTGPLRRTSPSPASMMVTTAS